MFRKTLLFILISIIFISCSFKTINYTYEFITFDMGIDFTNTSGAWLLNTVRVPEHRNSNSEEIVFETFSKWTNNKVTKKSSMVDQEEKKYFLRIPNKPSLEELELIHNTTNYKYIINVYSKKDINRNISRDSEIFIDVYDIVNKKLMLSQKVHGFLNKVNGNGIDNGINIIPEMMPQLIKKGLKNIEKNSKF